jgi:serine/threonine protein kinase
VHVDELGEERDLVYLVMPYISGGTLQQILKRRAGPLGLAEIQQYLEQICGALGYAHARKVVHLDLKPLNLLVHEDGRLLLSDFGLAHLIKEGIVEGGTSLSFGTPLYMAPEHLRGQPDWRSDLYAVGAMLYQMLTGRLPFEASTPEAIIFKLVTEPPPPLRSLRPDLPAALESVMSKALAKQPEARFQSASELLAAFKAALSARPSSAFSGPTQYNPQPALGPTIRASNPPGRLGAAPSGGLPNAYQAPTVIKPSPPSAPFPSMPFAQPAHKPARKKSGGWIFSVLGGLLAGIALFLPWFSVFFTGSFAAPVSESFSLWTIVNEGGSSYPLFWLEPIAAVVLILFAMLAVKVGKVAHRISILPALAGLGGATYFFFQIQSIFSDPGISGVTFTSSLEFGFWLAIGGFFLGLIGALIGLAQN